MPYLTGTNFNEWKQRVLFALGCMDLDIALRDAQPAELTADSTIEQKHSYEK